MARVCGLGFLVGLVLCGGCVTTAERGDEWGRLVPSAHPYESDLPLPVGFAIVERAMEDHSTGQGRTYLRHVYAGTADKFTVREFYRTHMPQNHWALVSDSAIKGDFVMRFAKGNEACVINLTDNGKLIGHQTLVQVRIAQELRGTTPPLARKHP